jgi:hypothetical protein
VETSARWSDIFKVRKEGYSIPRRGTGKIRGAITSEDGRMTITDELKILPLIEISDPQTAKEQQGPAEAQLRRVSVARPAQ